LRFDADPDSTLQFDADPDLSYEVPHVLFLGVEGFSNSLAVLQGDLEIALQFLIEK
jgi:hypothetical protein